MATITYKCNTCNRSIDILERPSGITSFGKCIITKGCQGKLVKIKRNINNIREKYPPIVRGLDDHVDRKMLYNFVQKNDAQEWTINHGLNSFPSTSVYVNVNNTLTLLDSTKYKTTFIDNNTIKIIFNQLYSGKVQLLSRTTYEATPKTLQSSSSDIQVSVNGYFIFAIPKYLTNFTYPPTILPKPGLPYDLEYKPIRIEVSATRPNQEEEVCNEEFIFQLSNTPWVNWNEILLKKRKNYYTITKNFLNFNTLGDGNINFSDIPDGTFIRFKRIDYGTGVFQAIKPEGLIALLTNTPFSANDKERNKIIDIGDMNSNTIDYFTYKNNEFYVSDKNVNKIYPEVYKVK